MAKWNDQRKNQQAQKRFRHKCRAYKYRKNNDAEGEKEIKLIKGMGRGRRAAIEVKCRSNIQARPAIDQQKVILRKQDRSRLR
jgi:hypothetical protein